MSLNALAVDLACHDIAACLLRRDGSLFLAPPGIGKPHSHILDSVLDDLRRQAGLDWQDVDLLAIGSGPGSFTGIRIAAATMAGINSRLHRPMLELSSLAVTARQTAHDGPLWVFEDARAGEVYVGHYAGGKALAADHCVRWQEVADFPAGPYACHNEPAIDMGGRQRIGLRLDRSQALAGEMQAQLGQATFHPEHLPVYPSLAYLQSSQAEKNAHA